MITTLTLNPVFDVHVSIGEFRQERENRARGCIREIGGKGINISRVLHAAGIETNAILVLPRENGADFLTPLKKEGIEPKVIEWDGRIRENITIHPDIGEETRLCFKGFHADKTLLNKVEAITDTNGIIAFSGSLPEGIDAADTEAFLLRLRERGARLIVDSQSVTLDMLKRIRPWLIKPNAEECEAYFGKLDEKGLFETALGLHTHGIENVMISLGGDGAVLASCGEVYRAHVPKISPLSTIGAGDSTVSGFIAAGERTPDERLRLAVSYGSAACLVEGTRAPRMDDVARIYDSVRVEKIAL